MAQPYEWYQSHTGLTVSFFTKGVDVVTSTCTLSPDHSTLTLMLQGKESGGVVGEHTLALYDAVTSATLTASSMRAEVKLTKHTQVTWPGLLRAPGAAPLSTFLPSTAPTSSSGGEGGGGGVVGSGSSSEGGAGGAGAISEGGSGGAQPAPPAPPPPQAAKPKKKDWSQLEAEADAEESKPEGEEALMSLFRNIFKGGSEETRKAMVKSFQTSGGTVLSTNWGEVEKTDYEKEREKEGKGGATDETGEKKK